MRLLRASIPVLGVVVLAVASIGCPGANRVRPVKMGDVNTGPGSLESVRRQLEGTWELLSADAIDPKGVASPRKATGTLTYDAFGNVGIAAKLADTEQPASSVSGLLAFTGRAVIDTPKSRLVLQDVEKRLPSGEALPAEVSADKVRYYSFEGDTLTLTVKDAQGVTTARTTWRKVR